MLKINNNTPTYSDLHPESKTTREGTGFSQINNNVINNIKSADAFLVWCYLYSKSSNWKVIKQNIKNVYGYGDAKIKKIFSYLKRANLIEYVQIKCANGRFAHVQVRILNGNKFDKNQPFILTSPEGHKLDRAVICTNGNDELLNKENTKEIKKQNTKSYCASPDARTLSDDDLANLFLLFWECYPTKKNKLRTISIWKKRGLDKIANVIIADVKNRKANDSQWQNVRYIPHPSTYLHNELWNDEITKAPPVKETGHKTKYKTMDDILGVIP